jgi:hypothetical protein
VEASPVGIAEGGCEIWLIYLPVVPFFALLLAYLFFVQYLSERKYENSVAIRCIVSVLQRLVDDDALMSENMKADIRGYINAASERIHKIHRISGFPAIEAPPREMESHLRRIAFQVKQMNMIVSSPGVGALQILRYRFATWLDVFLRAEYGCFQLDEGYEVLSLPWYRQCQYAIQRHWKKMLAAVVMVLAALGFTWSSWRYYWMEVASLSWLAFRYVILIVAVSAIYERAGAQGPSEKPESKWQSAVKLILFFFVPLFGLDALLQTGIVENIIRLVDSLKDIF